MVSVRIPLTQGKYAKVSIQDAERIRAFKWCAHEIRVPGSKWLWYAERGISRRGKSPEQVRMHWVIAGKGHDHINRDTLDNRRSNLRAATPSQQNMNRGVFSNNTSGATGVVRRKSDGKWMAYINKDKKRYMLGYFTRIEDAIAARKAAEIEMFGEYRAM